MPSVRAASTALRVSTSHTASWKDAATSATGTGSPESSRAWTHRATAVFSPEKEKSKRCRSRSRPELSPRGKSMATEDPDRAARSMCGPPGKGSPSRRATLSKASPAASSIVAPSGSTEEVTSLTRSSEEWPPDTRRARHGSGRAPCSSWSTATWAARWFTPYSGLPSAIASDFAAATPTRSAPARPGPAVTARASTSPRLIPAVSQARWIVGTIASRWAREATSGTTPPYRACSSTEDATASARSAWPRTTPTPVSSHEVSMPRTSGWSVTTP